MVPLLKVLDGTLSREEALKLTVNGQKMTAQKLDEIIAKPIELRKFFVAEASVITEMCGSTNQKRFVRECLQRKLSYNVGRVKLAQASLNSASLGFPVKTPCGQFRTAQAADAG